MFTCTWSKIDHIVRALNRFFVMLDDNDRIAKVAQRLQRVDEFDVVTLMQTNAWLIENIQYSDELGANLRCKPDALAFTPGQRASRSSRLRYSSPTLSRKSSRWMISFRIGLAISDWRGDKEREPSNERHARIDSETTSCIVYRAPVLSSSSLMEWLSLRRRPPPQDSHRFVVMNDSTHSLILPELDSS